MKLLSKIFIAAMLSSCVMASCTNNDDGSNTTENNDPGSADSLGAGQTNNNNVDNADAAFLSDAAYSDLKEIEAGNVAKSKGQAKEVKDLANMMVTEHTAMSEQIKALAAKKNVALRDTLSNEDRDMIRNSKKPGKDFDREYASMMVDDHEAAIRKFENASNNAKDPEIKALATEALPKLRHHLQMSKKAKDKVDK